MQGNTHILFLEINKSYFTFSVGVNDEQNNIKIIHKIDVPLIGIENNRISDFEKVLHVIKENIYLIEQNINHTFKEIVLILENFKPSFVNLTGYKKLNGSQILRENITYIINTLKSYVHETEPNKTILHIFNSKFNLDNKIIENLPIGLFGDSYSHELSFSLIKSSDLRNIKNIFDKCNLKLKKILVKSYISGAKISNDFKNIDTFFYIKCKEESAKIFYFENNSLKFQEEFNFGTNIIIQDICKITSLNQNTIRIILNEIKFLDQNNVSEELINEELFSGENYRKIKKKLIYQIAFARIKELFEIMIFKNLNLKYYINSTRNIFLELNKDFQPESLKEIYLNTLKINGNYEINIINHISNEEMLSTANKLVHFGWKKEAIPISQSKKSLIVRFFEAIFE